MFFAKIVIFRLFDGGQNYKALDKGPEMLEKLHRFAYRLRTNIDLHIACPNDLQCCLSGP